MTLFFIFLILLFLSAFFSSAETAFFSLTQTQIRLMQKEGKHGANRVYSLKKHPDRLLTTILIGNNIVNLFTASFATVVVADLFGSAALGIATGLTTIAVLIFGEIIPKSFAYAKNQTLARYASGPMFVLSIVFFPLSYILGWLSILLRKAAGIQTSQNKGITEEEIRTIARLGVEHGGINYREHEMVENIFRFDDTTVGEVMTPFYKVTLLNGDVPIEQIAHFVSHQGFSRYPVYKNDEDNIIGYLHVHHIMQVLNSDRREEPLKNFVAEIESVDEERKIERIFRAMKRERSHMYLVHKHGEPKNFIGIVTLEDLLEEIVGEIEDETDEVEKGV